MLDNAKMNYVEELSVVLWVSKKPNKKEQIMLALTYRTKVIISKSIYQCSKQT